MMKTTLLAAAVTTVALMGACAEQGGPSPYEADLPALGEPLPSFTGRTLSGATVDATTLAGKKVLVNHWFYQ